MMNSTSGWIVTVNSDVEKAIIDIIDE
jgi:hypothetical protein